VDVNDTAVAGTIPDQTFTGPGDQRVTVAADTYTDAGADACPPPTSTLANGDPLPAWLSFDSATRTFSGNPSASDTTPLDILVTEIGRASCRETTEIQLAVDTVNDTPVVAKPLADQIFNGPCEQNFTS